MPSTVMNHHYMPGDSNSNTIKVSKSYCDLFLTKYTDWPLEYIRLKPQKATCVFAPKPALFLRPHG